MTSGAHEHKGKGGSRRSTAALARRADAWWRTAAQRLGLGSGDELLFLVLVPLVGILTGFVAVGIYWTLDFVQHAAWRSKAPLLEAASAAPLWLRIVAPMVGGAIVSILVLITRYEVRGHGMSGIIEAVALKGGRVAARAAIVRELAGIATVGSGGSLGREGPMIRTGAMLGSVMGRWRLSGRHLKILVGCGAAAGMAAAYNAPVGAALFAMEVILGNFALDLFGPIVVASVLSTEISRQLRGAHPVYDQIPGYSLVSPWELPAYLALGVLGGIVSVAFTRGVRAGEPVFDRMTFVPKALRPIVGMALVGLLGIAFPEVYGNGFDTVNAALNERIHPAWILVIIPAVKLLATSITLGSGCSGGLFTPALLVGALLGGAFGTGVHALWPNVTATPGAYALVGMAAITAGTSHAPVSSIMILFELTGRYEIILPLMLASISSAVIARRIYPHSIYIDPLARRGVEIPSRLEEIVLDTRFVGELARQDGVVVAPATPLSLVRTRLLDGRRTHAFVVDAVGHYMGAVGLFDLLRSGPAGEALDPAIAQDAIDPAYPSVRTSERLSRALEKLARVDAERLPVIDENDRFAGTLAKRDVLAIYTQEVLGTQALFTRLAAGDQSRFVELPPGILVRELSAPRALEGRTLGDLALPQRYGIWAIAVERLIDGGFVRERATATTLIEPGDRLVLLGTDQGLGALVAEAAEAPSDGRNAPPQI